MSEVLKEHASAVIAAFVGGAVALFGNWSLSEVQDREIDLKYLNVALDILREDPEKSQISAVRSWAIDVINVSAPVKISSEARTQLLDKQLNYREAQLAVAESVLNIKNALGGDAELQDEVQDLSAQFREGREIIQQLQEDIESLKSQRPNNLESTGQ